MLVIAALLLTPLACAGNRRGGEPAPAPTTTAAPAPEGRETALSDVAQLTNGFSRAGEAYFSSDGSTIIFQATPQGEKHYAMYAALLNIEGERILGANEPSRISPPNSRNTCGFFAPDGKALIFASTFGKEKPDDGTTAGYQRQGGNYRWDFPEGMEVFKVELTPLMKASVHRLADVLSPATKKDAAAKQEIPTVESLMKPLTDNNAYDAEGAYSPDGKWIVFGSRRDGDSELYVMKPDGTGVVRLTNAKGYDGGPFFSPDGKRVIYRSDRKGNDLLQIFVADLAFDAKGDITGTRNERQLTDDANVNWGPYFHPDGKHVVYATSAHGHHNYEVYAMRDDGSHKTRITFSQGFDGLPVFSPDGKHLMWSSKRTKDNTTQIFVAKFTPPAGW